MSDLTKFGPLPSHPMPRLGSGYLETTYAGEPVECGMDGCQETIRAGDTYFVDTWLTDGVSSPICRVCGPCERYGRKKAMERGEYNPPKGAAK